MRSLQKWFVGMLLCALAVPALAWGQKPGRPRHSAVPREHVVAVADDVTVPADDEIKVRFLKPPKETDDKGKPRQLTSEELKALKGADPNLPGYTAEFGNLKPGQLVRVHLARKKMAKKEADADKQTTDQATWVKLGQITGRLTKVNGPGAAGTNNKDDSAIGSRQFTLHVESIALVSGRHVPAHKSAKGTISLGHEVYATMIVILQDRSGQKSQESKQ